MERRADEESSWLWPGVGAGASVEQHDNKLGPDIAVVQAFH